MKKYLFVIAFALVSVLAYAQPRAIGLRLGAFDGVSYQHSIGSNMLEIEAGFSVDGRTDFWENSTHSRMWGSTTQAAVTFDWIDPFGVAIPWQNKGEWHWYLGVGAAGGYGWRGYNSLGKFDLDWGFVGAAGRGGVEYDFWFPLQLSIDFRPTLGVSITEKMVDAPQVGLYWEMTCLALGVRYKF